MPLIYALAPGLLLAAAALFTLSRLGRWMSGGGAPGRAFERAGRLAMTVAVLAALPLATMLMESGSLTTAINDGYVSGMGSEIIR